MKLSDLDEVVKLRNHRKGHDKLLRKASGIPTSFARLT